MNPIELLPFYVFGLFGLIALHEIEKTIKLILQRLEWIHEDMKGE